MRTVEEACRILLERLRPPSEETVALAFAVGRRLSRPVYRRIAQPPFTRSRVDGYAVSLADLNPGGASGLVLTVAGVVLAGEEPSAPPPRGAALRVMAGAPLPEGMGAVVPFEEVAEGGSALPGARITLRRRPRPGENVISAGREGSAGSLVAPAGTACGPVEAGLLAAAGEAEIRVYRRPRVAVIATGSELMPLGEPLPPGRIYASNLHLLAALVGAWGGTSALVGPVPDRLAAVHDALAGAAETADLLLVTGGVAGGDRDLSRRVLADLGWSVVLDGVDFHPGGRCAVAEAARGGPQAFFLSGGPGACLTAAILLVTPVLAALGGGRWTTLPATLAGRPESTSTGVPSGRGRRRAVPVGLTLSDGRLWANPQPHATGSPLISPGTDGVILLPPGGGGGGTGPKPADMPDAGEVVEVWPLVPTLPEGGPPGKK